VSRQSRAICRDRPWPGRTRCRTRPDANDPAINRSSGIPACWGCQLPRPGTRAVVPWTLWWHPATLGSPRAHRNRHSSGLDPGASDTFWRLAKARAQAAMVAGDWQASCPQEPKNQRETAGNGGKLRDKKRHERSRWPSHLRSAACPSFRYQDEVGSLSLSAPTRGIPYLGGNSVLAPTP